MKYPTHCKQIGHNQMGKHAALLDEQIIPLDHYTAQALIGARHERYCTPKHRLDSPVDYLTTPTTSTSDRTDS